MSRGGTTAGPKAPPRGRCRRRTLVRTECPAAGRIPRGGRIATDAPPGRKATAALARAPDGDEPARRVAITRERIDHVLSPFVLVRIVRRRNRACRAAGAG